jgi:hypothetical protein
LEEKRPQKAKARRSSADAPLTQYRLYFLHSVERLISFSHEFEAESDERAIRIAEGWREGRRAELWSGARKLKSWDADN